MKKLISIFALFSLASCASHENYYLNNFTVDDNIESMMTAELAYKNIIYAKVLTNKQAIEQFGPDGDDYTVVYFEAENNSDDVSYFDFSKAMIEDDDEDISKIIKLNRIIKHVSLKLSNEDVYRNPFEDTDMEDNNFAFNLNNKVLTDFALQPGETKKGFLLFKKLSDAETLQFSLSSGVSIYTTRIQSVKLDQN